MQQQRDAVLTAEHRTHILDVGAGRQQTVCLKRIEKEYQSVLKGQDGILDRIDTYEEAPLGLNETVAANHEFTQREFAEIRQDISDLNEKMDRLMAHLKVPPKPPAGIVRE